MGTSLTTAHRLVKADDNEPIDVDQLNNNWNLLDKLIPKLILGGIPDGKTPILYLGTLYTRTGAGGENREAEFATTSGGIGGVWLGYNGIPKFEKVTYANISDAGNAGEFLGTFAILDQNATRIKYRGKRQESDAWTNAYPGINLNVFIAGW